MNWFTKRKRYVAMDGDQLKAMSQALYDNAHFKSFVEHLHERREDAIRAMQTEKAITCSNRHFMESGKLEAFDELLDDLELWWRGNVD